MRVSQFTAGPVAELQAQGLRRAFRNEASRVTKPESNNFGATVGQSQQLMQIFHLPCGTTVAKSLSALARQSNKFGALRRGQTCRVVMLAQLLSFSRQYVPLTDMAKFLGTRPSAVARRLKGVEVVGAKLLGGGARRGGLVRLVDLATVAMAVAPPVADSSG